MRIGKNAAFLTAPLAAAIMLGPVAASASPAAASDRPAMLQNCFTARCVSARPHPRLPAAAGRHGLVNAM